LDGVSEHAVEPDAQAPDAGPLALPPFEGGDPLARFSRGVLQLPQFGTPIGADEAALSERQRRIVLERLLEHLLQAGRYHDALADGPRERGADGRHVVPQRGELAQESAEADEVAGVGDPERRAAGEALEVADRFEPLAHRCPTRWLVDKRSH